MPEEVLESTVEETPVDEKESKEVKETEPATNETDEKVETEETEKDDDAEVSPHDRVSFKQLKQDFPDLFKKYPQLRSIYFREGEFSKVFSSVAQAKEAAESVDAYVRLEDDILTGDGSVLIKSLKGSDEKSLERFASNFVETLAENETGVLFNALTPIFKNICRAMRREGQSNNNPNLANSASYLAKYLFDDPEADASVEDKTDKKIEKVRLEERSKVSEERYEAFTAETANNAFSELSSVVAKALENDKDLTPYIKQTLIKDIISEVQTLMHSDKDHLKYIDRFWNEARRNGGNSKLKASIVNTFLARAKQLVPSVRSKLLTEVRGATPKSPAINHSSSGGRAGNANGAPVSAKDIDWNRTSDLDMIRGNYVLKGQN